MGRSPLIAVALGLALLVSAVPAEAQDAAATLDSARQALERRRAREAQEAVIELILAGGLSPGLLAEAYEIQGLAFVAMGDASSAEASFSTMLAVDPSHEPVGRWTLDAAESIAVARARRGDSGALRIEVEPESTWRLGGSPRLSAAAHGDPGGIVARLDVYYRPAGQLDFAVETGQGAGPHRFELTLLRDLTPQALEYYAEAYDDFGNQLVTRGNAHAPELVDPTEEVPSEPPPAAFATPRTAAPVVPVTIAPAVTEPWREVAEPSGSSGDDAAGGGIGTKWWFWGGLAAVAVGGVIGIVALSSGGESAPSPTTCFGRPCDVTVGPPP